MGKFDLILNNMKMLRPIAQVNSRHAKWAKQHDAAIAVLEAAEKVDRAKALEFLFDADIHLASYRHSAIAQLRALVAVIPEDSDREEKEKP